MLSCLFGTRQLRYWFWQIGASRDWVPLSFGCWVNRVGYMGVICSCKRESSISRVWSLIWFFIEARVIWGGSGFSDGLWEFCPDHYFPYVFGFFESNEGRFWKDVPECFNALDKMQVFIYCLSYITVINRWVIGCAENNRGFPLFVFWLVVYEPIGIG